MLRPALPNCPAWVTGSSRWKADRLIQASTVRGPPFGSPTRFGRLAAKPEIGGLLACSETLVESDTVNGVPELCDAMTFSCQSWSSARSAPRHRLADPRLPAGAGHEAVAGVEQRRPILRVDIEGILREVVLAGERLRRGSRQVHRRQLVLRLAPASTTR